MEYVPNLTSVDGIFKVISLLQYTKQLSPISVKPSGNTIFAKDEQLPNAYVSIVLVLLGNTIDVILEQYLKAPLPITKSAVPPSSKINSVIPLQ